MKSVKIAAAVLSGAVLLGGCMSPSATGLSDSDIHFRQFDKVTEGQELAVVETTVGKITMVLFPEEAPNTVAYFKQLVSEGFYNDKPLFAEAESKLMITGAVDEDGMEGKTPESGPIECEITQNLWHFSGAVSVLGYEKSKLSKQMLSDSRFFIIGDVDATTDMVSQMEEYDYPQKVIDAYKEHGGLPQYTGVHTVFGQVIEGMDVVDRIAALAVDEHRNPMDGTRIIKIELSTYQPEAASETAA